MFISCDLLPQRLRLLNKLEHTQPCSHPSEHQTDPSRAMAYQGLKLVHVVYIKLHCRARIWFVVKTSLYRVARD